MSRRPKTAGSFVSRLRRPAGRLRDMPIWSKLGLIMIMPTIATVVVGTTGLVDGMDTLGNANRAGDLANLTDHSGALVDSLQDERAAAVLLLGANNQTREQYNKAYTEVHKRVDAARGPYLSQRGSLDDLPANFDKVLDRIDQSLADLPGTRSQVFNSRLPLTDAARSYEGLINDLLDVRDSASQLAGNTDLSERMRAAAATARAKEFLSVRRVVVHRALIQGSMTPVLRTDYIATGTGQQQALQSFQSVANQTESELYQQTVAGSDQRQLENYLGWINGNSSESMAGAPFGANEWDAATVANAKLIRTVEERLDGDVVGLAGQLRSDVQRRVFLETGLLLSMLLLAIFFAYLVARSMARSLRDLRHGALSIAEHGLPQAVSRLRDPKVTGQLTPIQLANQIAEPLPVRSRDEFGQVTEAFNAVHLEAVRTAAEQAALRASVATMFVNLARRSQILVDRLIGHLDRLERGEEDPDRLAELFQLDHLATRMRRNDENLLVLAGADSTRVQREPAALIDVLRAAQSEVEHYTRIEFGVIDRDLEVAAHAVNDLVHLVAELFDNATAFSPPDSQVMVEARRVGDRASLYVEDRGIGISVDQLADLNDRLATPPQVDVAVSRMMGLVVVARLASRHGVKVELRPGTERGTVADVTLPTSVLVPRALSGRLSGPSALPTSASPAPAVGALPALPSGPASPADRSGGNQVTLGGRPFEPASRNGSPGSARPLPAWSDLTGAGANGADAGTSRPSGGLGDAFPARSASGPGDAFTPRPSGGLGDAFPARSASGAGDAFTAGPPGGSADAFTPRPSNGQQVDPLPQRRATEDESVDTGQQPVIPRQTPTSPEAWTRQTPLPVSGPPAPPVSAPPAQFGPPAPPVSGPPAQGRPVSGPPVSAPPASFGPPPARPTGPPPATPVPPAWPPVAGAERETSTPPVPERLAAALDMTTELPRIPRSASDPPPVAPPTSAAPAAPTAQGPQRYADETMELPIFRELESAWFRTRRPVNDETAGGAGAPSGSLDTAQTQQFAAVDPARAAVPSTAGTTGNAPMATNTGGMPRDNGATTNGSARPAYAESVAGRRDPHPTGSPWQTAADDGWRAASAASEVPVVETTQTGLPKRVPMAQLVPGGVEKPTTAVHRRTPEAVRGLLSAYHRGVQRGRSNPADGHSSGSEGTPGRQSSQSGSGPRAASGQKEQEG
ncbi:nitrate- and nitrite sensing domain-containing protein [Micromonospora sp. WMMD882]|uniref:sensor histidine kinase n=1 Tax=Micromonospora sp. WMMD882 TaxID=3015151 RepID=UPI00248C79D7|nr:nitrate- and nitrite sensing domain-containing protein [Micromonospora sp. WMMD882]WBB77536.1 nitrate- and nitrite sensing domain-containing protein [Micromonospora sp. WMMD882]